MQFSFYSPPKLDVPFCVRERIRSTMASDETLIINQVFTSLTATMELNEHFCQSLYDNQVFTESMIKIIKVYENETTFSKRNIKNLKFNVFFSNKTKLLKFTNQNL